MARWVLIIVVMGRVCGGIRLPGLDEDRFIVDAKPPAYVPFAAARGQHDYRKPAFKDGLVHVYTGGPRFDEETTTRPALQNGGSDFQMESLLNKIFGNESWKTFLKNPLAETDSQLIQPKPGASQNNDPAQSAGFFANEISVGNVFDQHGTGIPKTDTESMSVFGNGHKGHGRNNDVKSKTTGKHPGNFINTNLYGSKHEKSTTTRPFVDQRPITIVTPRVYSMAVVPANLQKVPVASSTMNSNNLKTDMFDPNAVNNFNSYNSNNQASFATQTGSNPQNMNWQINFDADKVNRANMRESTSHIEAGQLPGIAHTSLTSGKSNNDMNDRVFNAFNTRIHVPIFDASQLNQNLIDKNNNNWVLSRKPSGLMAPDFLSGNTNVQSLETSSNIQPELSENVPNSSTPKVVPVSNSNSSPKNNDAQEQAHDSSINTRYTTHKPTNSVVSTFDFVPGILYPGAGQNIQGQGHLHSENSLMANFNPNSINAQQVVFNPNSVSWIKSRTINKRQVDAKKMNHNNSDKEEVKNSFGDATLESISTVTPQAIGVTIQRKPDPKEAFGKPKPIEQVPLHSSPEVNTGFNLNNVNTDQQGVATFVPGQMSPYGNGGTASFYRPTNTTAKLLNFDIGSLLGMTGENGNNNGAIGMNALFNPTSLNKMMMGPFSQNGTKSQAGGTNAYYTDFDPNSANAGFSNVLDGAGSGFEIGSDVSNKSTNWSQGSTFGSGFTNGGFDANAANAGFGDVLKGGGNSGFGFKTAHGNKTENAAFGGFGAAEGFDPNSANSGFGSNEYGMGSLNGPVGAFGGSFNADKMNSGLQGKDGTADMKDMINYFLGVKVKNEGGATNSDDNNGLYNSGYLGTFDPSSVNQVSYNPNRFNNAMVHFNPTEMLVKNPGMDKDVLTNSAELFNPEKLNSMNKQQSFSPDQTGSYITGNSQGYQDNSNKGDVSQTGSSQGSTNSRPVVFDPFEIMKELMKTSNSFIPGSAGIMSASQTGTGTADQTTLGAMPTESVTTSVQPVTTSSIPESVTTSVQPVTNSSIPEINTVDSSTNTTLPSTPTISTGYASITTPTTFNVTDTPLAGYTGNTTSSYD